MNVKFVNICLVSILFLSGCISVPDSREPNFYGIAVIRETEIKPIKLSSDFAVAVSNIKIPGYLNRPQIVTQDKGLQMHFAQFHRWAEPFDDGITRVIKENLALILPRAQIVSYPLDFPSEMIFRLDMELTRFELDLSGELFLVVQWALTDVGYPKSAVIERSEFRVPVEGNDYPGAVKALSEACAALSNQIAQAIFKMSGGVGS